MSEGYQGFSDVAYNYEWAKDGAENRVGVGSLFRLAEEHGFRGGPPRVSLMDLVEPARPGVIETPLPQNRWAKLTRRGKAIQNMPAAGMLIPEWLRDKGFTILLAQRGTGKTVVAVDLALSVATGSNWMGERVAAGYHVVYLCGEDQENTAAHISAWALERSNGVVPDNFTFIEDVPDLTNWADCKALATHLRTVIADGNRALIIADTWQRATSKARDGQNSDRDMAQAVENLETLASAFKGPAVGCFHPPKVDKTTVHGSSVTENTSTGIWQLTKEDAGLLRLEVTRIKGRGLGNYKRIRTEEVGLARQDEFRREMTGVIAIHVGGTTPSFIEFEAREEFERQAVLRAALKLIDSGIGLVRANGAGQKPEDIAKVLSEQGEFHLTKRQVRDHLNALERDGALVYVEADKNQRIKAGFQRPHMEVPKGLSNA